MRQPSNDFELLGAALFAFFAKGADFRSHRDFTIRILFPPVIVSFGRKLRSFREPKPRPFQNREESGTRKVKYWRNRLVLLLFDMRNGNR